MSGRGEDYWAPLDLVGAGAGAGRGDRAEHEAVAEAFAGAANAGGWMRAVCPLCPEKIGKDSRKASLGYNPETGGYSCKRCDSHGRLDDDLREALPFAAPARDPAEPPGPEDLPEPCWGYLPLYDDASLADPRLDAARAYLETPRAAGGRGLPVDVCRAAGLGTATWGKLRGRVVVPLPDYVDPDGPWCGWVARDYTDAPMPDGSERLKYLYAKRFVRETYLYNLPSLTETTDRPLYVVEGALDALALWPDAVALMGGHSTAQRNLLAQASRPVVILLDGDAWEVGWMLGLRLRFYGRRAGSIKLPPRTDPDEVPRDWLDAEAARALVA